VLCFTVAATESPVVAENRVGGIMHKTSYTVMGMRGVGQRPLADNVLQRSKPDPEILVTIYRCGYRRTPISTSVLPNDLGPETKELTKRAPIL
jgi:hypothetical protein